jgi:hypothetical protein
LAIDITLLAEDICRDAIIKNPMNVACKPGLIGDPGLEPVSK